MSALLAALVDDAGLFPPTALSMTEAVTRHRRDLAGGDPMLAHRFLCPVGRIDELRAALAADDRFSLGLIVPAGTPVEAVHAAAAAVAAEPRLKLTRVEITCHPDDLETWLAGADLGVPMFVESIDTTAIPRLTAALSGTRAGLKIRCGGVPASRFPGPAEIAEALVAAAAAGVAVKATAGLHRAVRHHDPMTGFSHHGYLNLLVAAARAAAGTGLLPVARALARSDGASLAAEAHRLTPAQVAAARRLLAGYGSCSTQTPPADALALGLTTARPLVPQGVRS